MKSTSNSTWSDYVRAWEFAGNSYYDTKANESLGTSFVYGIMDFVTGSRSGKTALQANSTGYPAVNKNNLFSNPVISNQFSMSFWYTRTTTGDGHMFVSPINGASSGQLYVNSTIPVSYWGCYNNFSLQFSTIPITVGSLYHVCFTVDNYDYKLYINGVLVLTQTMTKLYSNNVITLLGNDNSSPAYNPLGKFESIYQWQRVLTPTEIIGIFNQG